MKTKTLLIILALGYSYIATAQETNSKKSGLETSKKTKSINSLINLGIITAQVGISNNLHTFLASGLFCDPKNDFDTNANSFFAGTNKLCKPKWKTAKNVKFKSSESCHYIKVGNTTREIQISTKYDG